MKNILVVASYLSGNGGMEKVISRMKVAITGKANIDVLSLTDGIYDNSIKPKKYTNWISDAYYLRVNLKLKVFNVILHILYSIIVLLKKDYQVVVVTGPFQAKYYYYIRKFLFKKFDIFGWPHFSASSNYGDFEDFKHCNKILCISRGLITQFEKLGFSSDKLKYFPNIFIKNSFSLKDSSYNNLLFVGRIQYEQQKRLIDILSAIKKSNTNISLKIIGSGSKKDIEQLSVYIKENELKNISIENSWIKNPWKFANKKTFLVMSSEFEGLPTVIGEAMSLGIPVISSDCATGPSDFIKNNLNGLLFPVRDTDSLSEIIKKIERNELNFDANTIKESMSIFYEESYNDRAKEIFNI